MGPDMGDICSAVLSARNVGIATASYNFLLLLINLFFVKWEDVKELNPGRWGRDKNIHLFSKTFLTSKNQKPFLNKYYVSSPFFYKSCCF